MASTYISNYHPIRTCTFISCIIALLCCLQATPAVAQDGYLVLHPVEGGPVTIRVNGKVVAELSTTEVTLTLKAGTHAVEAYKDGALAFQRRISLPADEVVQLQVTLASRVRVAEDDTQAGAGLKGQLRIIHLDPVRVSIEVDNRVIGHTPATLEVPVGRVNLKIGQTDVCVHVKASTTGRIRLRNGEVEALDNTDLCTDVNTKAILYGVPHGAVVRVDGLRVSGSGPLTLGGAGLHNISIEHEEYLSISFELSLTEGQHADVWVDMGPPKPQLPTVAQRQSLPPRPQSPQPPARPLFPTLNDARITSLERDANRLRAWSQYKVLGYLVAIGGYGLMFGSKLLTGGAIAMSGHMITYVFSEIPSYIEYPGCQRDKGRQCRKLIKREINRLKSNDAAQIRRYNLILDSYRQDSLRYEEQKKAGFPEVQRRLAQWRERVEEIQTANEEARSNEKNRERLLLEWRQRARKERNESRFRIR